MSSGSIHENFSTGPAQTGSLFVGPNSKLIAGCASVGTAGSNFTVKAEINLLGSWLPISTSIGAAGLVKFPDDLEGNIPAGTELRLRLAGSFADASVFMLTS